MSTRTGELIGLLASKFTDDELLKLCMELDEDCDSVLYMGLVGVIEKRNPKMFAAHFVTDADVGKVPG